MSTATTWLKNNDWLSTTTDDRIRWRPLRRFATNFQSSRTLLLRAGFLAVVGSSTALLIPLIFRALQGAVVRRDVRTVVGALLFFAAVMLIDIGATYWIRAIRAFVSSQLNRTLVLEYYRSVLDAAAEDFIAFKQRTNLYQRLVDAMSVTGEFTDVIVRGGQAALVIVIVSVAIATVSPLILAVLLLGSAALFAQVVSDATRLRRLRRRLLAVNFPLVGKMIEVIGGLFTMKALAASLRVSSDIDMLVSVRAKAEHDEGVAEARSSQIAQSLRTVVLTASIACSFALVFAGRLRLGDVLALYILSGMLLTPTVELAAQYQVLSRLSVNISNYYEVIDLPSELQAAVIACAARMSAPPRRTVLMSVSRGADTSRGEWSSGPQVCSCRSFENADDYGDAAPNIVATAGMDAGQSSGRGHIVFSGVNFAYRNHAPLLEGIDLEICAGERISLIGRSGAGKTTLFRLLLGFLHPQYGRILVDGVDVPAVTDRDLYRRQFGVVSQQDVLFGMSLRENLLFGSDHAASAAELEATLQRVDLWKRIATFPRGIEETYSDDLFSGGQKQRLFIARALLRHPSIVLLDEPTSALDFENEHDVLNALHQLLHGKTSITIAHRLSTVRSAERVVVLGDGRVQAVGTHDDLYESNAYYRSLCTYNSFIL